MRKDWDVFFMKLAFTIGEQSTCRRRNVGAVAVRDKRILATGFNGAPRNTAHCTDIGCLREKLHIPSGERHELCRGAHAEANVVTCAANTGVSLAGATLYVTNYPCAACAKLIINTGFTAIYYANDYNDELAKQLFREADVSVTRLILLGSMA